MPDDGQDKSGAKVVGETTTTQYTFETLPLLVRLEEGRRTKFLDGGVQNVSSRPLDRPLAGRQVVGVLDNPSANIDRETRRLSQGATRVVDDWKYLSMPDEDVFQLPSRTPLAACSLGSTSEKAVESISLFESSSRPHRG